MSDVVKADVRAIRELRKSVARYAEELRAAVALARRETLAAERRLQGVVDQRRQRSSRAISELQQARDAVARAPKETQADYRQAVTVAQQRAALADQEFRRAHKTQQSTASASSDLRRTLQAVAATVDEQSAAASSILAILDKELTQISGGQIGSIVRTVVDAVGVSAEIAVATMNLGQAAGNISQGRLSTADHFTSISEMKDQQTENQQQPWKDVESERRKYDPLGESQAEV